MPLILPRRRALVLGGAAAALASSKAQATTTTWNPSDKSANITLSNNNLTATLSSAAQGAVRSSTSVASGKVYFEATLGQVPTSGVQNYSVGIVTSAFNLASGGGIGGDLNSIGVYPIFAMQTYLNNNAFDQAPAGQGVDVAGDVLRFAVDLTAGLFWWSSTKMVAQGNAWNNRTLVNSNPATGVGGDSMSGMSAGPFFVAYCDGFTPSSCTVNFGATAFSGSLPSGYSSWNNAGQLCFRRERDGIFASAGVVAPAASGGNPGGSSGTGPVASSAFLTADFASVFNYPNGGSGQQVVSQRMWGTSTGGAGNNNFAVMANAAYQTQMAIANPGVWYFKNSGQAYWNGDLSINAAVVSNLVNNFYKCDPLGISGVIIGCDWNQVPNGEGNPATWATGMTNLATYLYNFTMPNGKKFPLVGMMGRDEPDGTYTEAVTASYYNALGPQLKAISNSILLVGPNLSYIGWGDFGSQVSSLDVFSYDYYQSGTQFAFNDGTAVNSNNFTTIGQSAAAATGANTKITMFGGYNIDWNCSAAAQNSYVGAAFIAKGMIQSLNQANRQLWACVWDSWGDGTCGITTDPGQSGGYYGVTNSYTLTPKGYFNGAAVRNVYGQRWGMPNNSAGMSAIAVTPAAGRLALLVVNFGQGSQSNQSVALSHWPVNSTGNGIVNVWQMTSAVASPGTDGTKTTATVTNGLATLSFPDPSITVIYV